ncbi:MAG: hypothetical protein ACI9BW_004239 [Gammaproteobacteria bacterium]
MILNAQARLQSDGTLQGFKLRVRSCRRWQLSFLQLDLRGALHLDMHLRFRDPRRSQVTPFGVRFLECLEYTRFALSSSSLECGLVDWFRKPLQANFHYPAFFAIPVFGFIACAFVVLFLAFGEAEFNFRFAAFPVHCRGDDGVAFAIDGADEAGYFSVMEEEFSGPSGVRIDVRRGGEHRRDDRALQKCLAIF